MAKDIDEEWIADTKTMTCRNKYTKIIVGFQKKEISYIAKILYIPLKMRENWTRMNNVEGIVRKIITEAEEAFWRAKTAENGER